MVATTLCSNRLWSWAIYCAKNPMASSFDVSEAFNGQLIPPAFVSYLCFYVCYLLFIWSSVYQAEEYQSVYSSWGSCFSSNCPFLNLLRFQVVYFLWWEEANLIQYLYTYRCILTYTAGKKHFVLRSFSKNSKCLTSFELILCRLINPEIMLPSWASMDHLEFMTICVNLELPLQHIPDAQ